jgi:hypothetical protein
MSKPVERSGTVTDDLHSPSVRSAVNSASLTDFAVIAAVIGLGLAYLPIFFVPTYTPRLALIIVLMPLGAWNLAVRIKRREGLAVASGLLLFWLVVGCVFDDRPLLRFFGGLSRESSGLIVSATVLALFAACGMTEQGRYLLLRVVLVVLSLNALIGIAQSLFNTRAGWLKLYDGRATGLLVGHVYFGACMAGACVLLVSSVEKPVSWRALSVLACFSSATNLSGSRFAVVVGLVGVLIAGVRSVGTKRMMALLATFIGSIIATSLLISVLRAGDETATARVGTAAGAGRAQAWWYGLRGLLQRPVTGWGFGRYRVAAQGWFGPEFTAAHARDETREIWFDPHNLVVNVAVSLGFVGLFVALALAFCLIRSCRGPLAGFAAVVAVTWMLQPAALATFPLAMICLGAATPLTNPSESGERERLTSTRRIPVHLLLLLGLVGGGSVIAFDLQLDRAVHSRSADRVADAIRWVPWDPVAADTVSQSFRLYEPADSNLTGALEWAREAARREPDRPYFRNRLAELQLATGDLDGAARTLEIARGLQPWNVRTLVLSFSLANRSEDSDLQSLVESRLCRLELMDCSA